ncbi:MAG TPA: alpha/beta hydrolase [Thermoanaerobaculia bacterium]|nr:alpha/beta hydrolase [Thermoanaerobaculia bacterium]
MQTDSVATTFVETPLTLEVDGMRFPAMLTVPAAGDPVSAVLLVPGSLFLDVDGDYPSWNVHPHMYADLARQLAARGHAVLRYAKPGPGTGTVTFDRERAQVHLHFAERVVVARAALKTLRDGLGEKAAKIRTWTVAGHSEGAVVASLLAAEEPALAGVVSLSGPSTGLLSIMRDQAAAMPGAGDLSFYDDALARIRRGEPLAPEAARHPQTAMLAGMDPKSLGYLREVDAVDPSQALAAVDRPVLLVQGGRDGSVPEKHAHRLREARGTKPSELVFLDDLQHFYKHAEPGMDPQAAFALSTPTDLRVAEAIDRWVRSLPKK